MELLRALAALSEQPAPEHERVWRSIGIAPPTATQYTDVFVFALPPYASIYLGADGMLGGEPRERIAGFWHALGLTPPLEPDHLAALLGLVATLGEDAATQARHARHALLHEHLLSWLPAYLAKFNEIAPAPLHGWASLLSESLAAQAHELPEFALPAALRELPEMPDPEHGATEFVSALLAPARSGVLLVRHDLSRAAQRLGLGLRAGERRFALVALFEQDSASTLRWLCEEADGWIERHRANVLFEPAVRDHWMARAQATMQLLRQWA